MKILRVEPYEINDDSLPKITMPTDAELSLASKVATNGEQLLKYWFEFNEKLQNADGSKLRNRAGSDIYNAYDLAGFPAVRSFTPIGLDYAMTTKFRAYEPLPWVPSSAGYTLFAVVKVSADLASTANTFLIGQTVESAGNSVNLPSINFTPTNLKVYQYGVSNQVLSVAVADLTTKYQLITLTQSVEKGVTLRVNGSQLANYVTALAKAECTGTSMRILGGAPAGSANFNGSVAALLICPEDLTSRADDLVEIENYLISKYKLV